MSDEKEYTSGFNNGYLLSQYEPDLTAKITKDLQANTEYLEGFFSGKEEYEIEKSLQQFNELQNLRKGAKDRNKDLEQEK
jgi:hypothetical protein